MKCCICGKEIKGFGNSPMGAHNENKKMIQWAAHDVCCDECNRNYVIPGRIFRYSRVIRPNQLVKQNKE